MASHYKIMNYWRDKAICKNGKVITENEAREMGFKNTIAVVKDCGEPMCWGCSKPIISSYEESFKEQRGYNEDDLKQVWSGKKLTSKLHRCHIVPKALKGSDEPKNLFLLCIKCHELSPDTTNSEAFFRWIYKQRENTIVGFPRLEKIAADVNEELILRGLPGYEKMKHCIGFKNVNIFEMFKENVSTHGAIMSYSSKIVAIADVCEEAYRKGLKDNDDVVNGK